MGPLYPRPAPAAGGLLLPLSPGPPNLGCLCRAEPSRPGRLEAASLNRTPQAGGVGWGKVLLTPPMGSPSALGDLRPQGSKVGEGKPSSECTGGVTIGVKVLAFQFGFCCVTLSKSFSLSGHLCYRQIISEVPENCDSTHLPQERACPPPGASPQRYSLLLQVPGPRWAEGAGSWLCPLPLLDPQALPQTCQYPVHCLHVTDESDPLTAKGTPWLVSQRPASPLPSHAPRLAGLKALSCLATVSPHLCVCVCPHFLGAQGQPSSTTCFGSPHGHVYVGNSCTK